MAKKRKVYISPIKALALLIIVISLGLFLLYISNKPKNENNNPENFPSISERFETSENKNKDTIDKNIPQNESQKVIHESNDINQVQNNQSNQSNQTGKKNDKNVSEQKPAENQPSKDSTNTNSQNKYDFPKAKNNAQLIFVFDDGGQNLSHLDKFLSLPFPITVAVLPKLTYSKQAADKIRKSGNELILHQPMQSISNTNPGPGAITTQMTEDEILSTLFTNITEIGPVAGINNHEGSAVTADEQIVSLLLSFSSDNGIFFLDSRTNVETKIPYVASEMGFSYYERNIFLDNEKSKENALTELKKGLSIANKNGTVIMIGHITSAEFLPSLLQEIYPELVKQGYKFSVISKSNALKY